MVWFQKKKMYDVKLKTINVSLMFHVPQRGAIARAEKVEGAVLEGGGCQKYIMLLFQNCFIFVD